MLNVTRRNKLIFGGVPQHVRKVTEQITCDVGVAGFYHGRFVRSKLHQDPNLARYSRELTPAQVFSEYRSDV